MSDSEGEVFNFDVSDSESDDYAPAPKKTAKAPPKKAASKPATKAAPKAAAKATAKTTKKKTVADKENDASDVEPSSDDDDNAFGPSKLPTAKKKTASETYQKASMLLTRIYGDYSSLKHILTQSIALAT